MSMARPELLRTTGFLVADSNGRVVGKVEGPINLAPDRVRLFGIPAKEGGQQVLTLWVRGRTSTKFTVETKPRGVDVDIALVTEAGGVKQYVTYLRKGLVGVDAKTGKFLWRYAKTIDPGANIMTPVVYKDRLFVSTSRGGMRPPRVPSRTTSRWATRWPSAISLSPQFGRASVSSISSRRGWSASPPSCSPSIPMCSIP